MKLIFFMLAVFTSAPALANLMWPEVAFAEQYFKPVSIPVILLGLAFEMFVLYRWVVNDGKKAVWLATAMNLVSATLGTVIYVFGGAIFTVIISLPMVLVDMINPGIIRSALFGIMNVFSIVAMLAFIAAVNTLLELATINLISRKMQNRIAFSKRNFWVLWLANITTSAPILLMMIFKI